MKSSSFLFVAIVSAVLCSCNNNNMDPAKRREAMIARMDSLRHDLLNTDIAFSQLSEQKGRNAAFIEYAAENATFLRPNSMPVSGKDTLVSLLKMHPDTGLKLTWMPIRAEVAHSGDLGFTYGTYSLALNTSDKAEGTYCTIWKKDKDHKWKFVLDTGNEGLNPAEKAEEKKADTKLKKETKKVKKRGK